MATKKTKSKKKSAAKKKPVKKKSASKAKPKKAAAKPKAKKKAVAKAKSKAKPKTKAKAKAKAKTKTKAKPAVKSKAKAKPVAKKKAPAKKAKAKVKEPKVVATDKILSKKFLVDLASAIRDAVQPEMTNFKGRDIVGAAESGDATFHIDSVAEKTLLSFLEEAKKPIAYYSEDAGYTTFTAAPPKYLLVVDPIDGTRAAKSGFEGCVVSICCTRVMERPDVADIDNALVMELTQDRYFYAERGKGAKMYVNGNARKIKLADLDAPDRMAWAMTVPARPAELIFPVSDKLIDVSSLHGGFFACNSSSYSLTRLLTNQLDASVDIANRFYRDIPEAVEHLFINAGRGNVIGICPYDYAAALLIVQEAGCIVTDAYGKSFDDVLLLDSTSANHQSFIAATNKSLHKKLLGYYDTRIGQWETLLKQRHEAR